MSSNSISNSRPYSKLKNIELSDGWAFVTRSRGSGRSHSRKPQSKPNPQRQDATPNQSHVARIVDQVENNFKKFDISDYASSLNANLPVLENGIDVAVCAGLGTLDPDSDVDTRRSTHQLAIFLWLVKVVATEDCKLFANDPSFTPTDKAVLEHFKARVDDGAEPRYGPAVQSALLYAPYLPWPVLTLDYLSNEDARPAVVACQDLRLVKENLEMQRGRLAEGSMEVDGRTCNREDLEKAVGVCEGVVSGYDATAFPRYEPLSAAFQDMVVYVRQKP
jgi:hypothetical protein